MKTKKAYIALQPLEASVAGTKAEMPKGMTFVFGVFSSKKEAQKWSKNIQEIILTETKI